MNETTLPTDALHRAVLHLPILTTLVSAAFATVLLARYRAKGGGPHLLWWGIGMITYGLGTFTESWTTLFGWHPAVFKLWYVTGAFLGGYPLAQGSIYLLANRKFADWSARVVVSVIAIGAILVALSPLDLAAAETHRLSGKVLGWQELRMLSPFINLYSVIFLAGGAAVSALRYRREVALRDRYVGNILIAVGAILPGIGGAMTRFGFVEALYVTELLGILLIFAGYRRCVKAPPPISARVAPAAALATALVLLLVPATARAADESAEGNAEEAAESEPRGSFWDATTVTATGSERDTFQVATPVTVVTAREIERLAPDNAADLLREQPGVDVNGIGPNQARPVIRGQRGLRVLFLEDGLRLNNARRQTDFGEISGLVDLDSVATVEVVRGPASVLYGSDAIGGVLNLVTRPPRFEAGRRFTGGLELRYGSAAESERASAFAAGGAGRWDWQLGASSRSADSYDAPSGRFGDIRLDRDAPVLDSGIDDDSLWGSLGLALDDRHSLRLRLNRYRADESGFGLVEPKLYGVEEAFRIRILYPFQDFDRWTLAYFGSALESPFADSIDARIYWQSNERQLVNDIDIDIGPVFPRAPSSTVAADTRNFTDLDTRGLRLEAIKALGTDHLMTYGLEAYEDDSFNTDFSRTTTTFRFPFPPSVIGLEPGFTCIDFVPPFECVFVTSDDVANAPNAENQSWGVFAQDEWTAGDKLRVTGGLRYQKVSTTARPTPGWDVTGLDFDDDALVGAVTATWQVRPEINLLASYGTAFRAPNIIERLFNGLTPEGAGYQILNPDLQSESSDNIDLGIKYRRQDVFFELVVFRTDIDDGVVQYFLSDQEILQLPQDAQDDIAANRVDFVVQQRNAERLRYEGLEVALGYRTSGGWVFGGNYTYLDSKRLDSTNPPTGDTYGDKLSAYVRWQPEGRPLWIEYRVRHNASTAANLDADEPVPPVGTTLPSFTVHTLAGGATLFERRGFSHEIRLAIENLTDELYAEFSNATFFRPEPGRNVTASYRVRF